jgi:ribosomal protein L32
MPTTDTAPLSLNACPKCGSTATFTWGMPLPGQYAPPKGTYDSREREHRSCLDCMHIWHHSGKEQP